MNNENDTNQKATGEKRETALFAQLIEILTQNAVLMLGGVPDRQGRQRPPDLNAAEMMIDMLAVLQLKTKGNLSKDEEKMISGTLYQLQSAFADVASRSGEFEKARKATESAEAVSEMEAQEEEEEINHPISPQQQPSPSSRAHPQAGPQKPTVHVEETRESKVKFTKKYE